MQAQIKNLELRSRVENALNTAAESRRHRNRERNRLRAIREQLGVEFDNQFDYLWSLTEGSPEADNARLCIVENEQNEFLDQRQRDQQTAEVAGAPVLRALNEIPWNFFVEVFELEDDAISEFDSQDEDYDDEVDPEWDGLLAEAERVLALHRQARQEQQEQE